IARAGLHATVDATDAEAPGLKSVHEIVQRVPELGEEEQALVRVIEESFFLKKVFELRELCLGARFFNRLGLGGQAAQFLTLLTHLVSAARERDCLKHRLQPLALTFLHLLELFRIREIRRRLAGKILGTLEPLFQPTHAVLKRAAHALSRFTKRVTSR